MKFKTAIAALAPALLLAACEEEAGPDTSETGGEAAGEVLGGTISDDMIALGELTSTSPPAPRVVTEGGSGESSDAPTGEAEGEEAEASDAETPASDTPAPEAPPEE